MDFPVPKALEEMRDLSPSDVIRILEGSTKPGFYSMIFVILLVGCSLTKPPHQPPPPDPLVVQEQRARQGAAREAARVEAEQRRLDHAQRVREANARHMAAIVARRDCILGYAAEHARATANPADIVIAARGSCRQHEIQERNAIRAIDSLIGGPYLSQADLEAQLDATFVAIEPLAVDVIVRARTPAKK